MNTERYAEILKFAREKYAELKLTRQADLANPRFRQEAQIQIFHSAVEKALDRFHVRNRERQWCYSELCSDLGRSGAKATQRARKKTQRAKEKVQQARLQLGIPFSQSQMIH